MGLIRKIFSSRMSLMIILALVVQAAPTSVALSEIKAFPEMTLSGSQVAYSSPLVADVDGNPQNGLEIITADSRGKLYVYRADGTLVYERDIPGAACSSTGSPKVWSSPAAGELYGDGVPYIVIGYGGLAPKSCDGGVAAFRGSDGLLSWNFSIRKYSKKARYWAFRHSVVSTPALADVDNDGKLEIGFGSFDRHVYLLNSNGTVRWYYIAADTVWSSPAFADANGDGKLEMIIGTDISANKHLRPPTKNGGIVYALKTAPRKKKAIGFRDRSAYLWMKEFDQVIFSAPIVADLIPGNPGEEVAVQSGCFFPQNSGNKKGKWIKILSLKSGAVLRTLPLTACSPSSPAAADIDADGLLELIATSNGRASLGGDGFGRVFAYKAGTSQLLWSTAPRVRDDNDDYLGDFKSPVIADLDGNGSLEVIVSNGYGAAILDGPTGIQLTCQSGSCPDLPASPRTGASLKSSPAVGDLDLDGLPELVLAGRSRNSSAGAIFLWKDFQGELNSTTTAQAPFSMPWPLYRKNTYRNGH